MGIGVGKGNITEFSYDTATLPTFRAPLKKSTKLHYGYKFLRGGNLSRTKNYSRLPETSMNEKMYLEYSVQTTLSKLNKLDT